jgi:hypothetical protein
MILKFRSDALQNAAGFMAIYSADCPMLKPGKGVISSSKETIFGSFVRLMCPEGQEFATGVKEIVTECQPGGKWTRSYIPPCQEVST